MECVKKMLGIGTIGTYMLLRLLGFYTYCTALSVQLAALYYFLTTELSSINFLKSLLRYPMSYYTTAHMRATFFLSSH